MLEITGQKIRMTRGDTAFFTVEIIKQAEGGKEPSAYIMQAGDTLTFSVKKYIRSDGRENKADLQKTVRGGTVIHILPEDTKGLPFGRYHYDVQLDTAGGDVFTVIGDSEFELLAEVKD